jgi:predicted dehydrogenase
VDLVVLCSPRRDRQPDESIRCLEAGKHVYAEKPCALHEVDLDRVLAAAAAAGRRFHEMAGTAFSQPYYAMRQVVAAGTLGTVVQVLAQKSYPLHDRRPQDEGVDGGLTRQAGVHAARMIEHVAGVRVTDVQAVETALGNPLAGGGLRIAASLIMRLANGGVASLVANYLNPPAFGRHGNETLRIFGTAGMLEATDGGARTRLVLRDRDAGALDVSAPAPDWLTAVVDEIVDGKPMPLSLDDELHPTRVVIRAQAAAARWKPA